MSHPAAALGVCVWFAVVSLTAGQLADWFSSTFGDGFTTVAAATSLGIGAALSGGFYIMDRWGR